MIEVDEVTLHTHCRNDGGEKESFDIGDGPLSSGVNSSPSQSSIGKQYVTLDLNIHTLGCLQSSRIWVNIICMVGTGISEQSAASIFKVEVSH